MAPSRPGLYLGAFLLVVLAGLWVLFGFKMRAGRNWARITLTVLAGVWLLISAGNLLMMLQGFGTAGKADLYVTTQYLRDIISLLILIPFLVLVYLRASNWFFIARRMQ